MVGLKIIDISSEYYTAGQLFNVHSSCWYNSHFGTTSIFKQCTLHPPNLAEYAAKINAGDTWSDKQHWFTSRATIVPVICPSINAQLTNFSGDHDAW